MLTITKVSGPIIVAKAPEETSPKVLETVYVGPSRLMGEIIGINGEDVSIQVYEDTSGLQIGEQVELTGELLSVELGPGIMGNIFDGIQRPLDKLDEVSPIFIQPGVHVPSLDRDKEWDFIPTVQMGQAVNAGDKLGYVQENSSLKHWILVPEGKAGEVVDIKASSYKVTDTICQIKQKDEVVGVTMYQKWPVKIARGYEQKQAPKKLFKTGQRVIDAMFPIMLGGKISTPGPFGSGKSFTQQQVAKWSDAQIVIFIGCGERGNELTEMVKGFPELKDPRTGESIMDRTVLIANTSNMPIAAREASIYTGITIAEYFRDMGYDVVLMADSTSRWAEAMREVSQRLGEMPSEEGFPAYLPSRISAFYERAGVVTTYGGETGSVTVIGTVSPPGGDFAEPVTNHSLKNSQVFLALDADLAAQRHYPAINWKTSFSLYDKLYNEQLNKQGADFSAFAANRKRAKEILAREEGLLDLVKIAGMDGLSNKDRLVLEIAKSLREDFLQQNGFDKIDTYCSYDKMMAMMAGIISIYDRGLELIALHPDNEEIISELFSSEVKKGLSDIKYCESTKEVHQAIENLQKGISETIK